MLGRGSAHAPICFTGGFIGTDFDIIEDLTRKLPDEWRDFNRQFIPVLISKEPERSKISAGLACGALWTVSKGIRKGDFVLCPDGAGVYRVGEVTSDYYYAENQILPHRRRVRWLDTVIARALMSDSLRNSSGSIGTVGNITIHHEELDRLINAAPLSLPMPIVSTDPDIEDPVAFAMEKHLEEFLVSNWSSTLLSKEFAIFEEEGIPVGKQYPTDAGPIDILAISHDKKRVLVVELKRGRASDVVVGQILRYMGFVKEQIAESDQTVEGIIIALDDDQKLRWALLSVPSISFYRYQISFKLIKA